MIPGSTGAMPHTYRVTWSLHRFSGCPASSDLLIDKEWVTPQGWLNNCPEFHYATDPEAPAIWVWFSYAFVGLSTWSWWKRYKPPLQWLWIGLHGIQGDGFVCTSSKIKAEQPWTAGAQSQGVALDNNAGSGSPGSCQPGTLCLASTHSTGVASPFTKNLSHFGNRQLSCLWQNPAKLKLIQQRAASDSSLSCALS